MLRDIVVISVKRRQCYILVWMSSRHIICCTQWTSSFLVILPKVLDLKKKLQVLVISMYNLFEAHKNWICHKKFSSLYQTGLLLQLHKKNKFSYSSICRDHESSLISAVIAILLILSSMLSFSVFCEQMFTKLIL